MYRVAWRRRMRWRNISAGRIGGFVLVGVALATLAVAATRSPLADAAEKHDQTTVRTLLKSGADVNAAQVDGTTALHWAAYQNDAEIAALLLKAGANVNAANSYGVPPLAEASKIGSSAMVKLLLDAGANANATLKGGETILMLAARSGNLD